MSKTNGHYVSCDELFFKQLGWLLCKVVVLTKWQKTRLVWSKIPGFFPKVLTFHSFFFHKKISPFSIMRWLYCLWWVPQESQQYLVDTCINYEKEGFSSYSLAWMIDDSLRNLTVAKTCKIDMRPMFSHKVAEIYLFIISLCSKFTVLLSHT